MLHRHNLRKIQVDATGIPFLDLLRIHPHRKKVDLKPSWRGISGCFTVYGDVSFSAKAVRGIEIYGFAITCYAGNFKLHTITAFNTDNV